MRVQLVSRVDAAAESTVALTLAQAVLKGDKMDEVIRDAVMLGVAAIQPIVTKRSGGHRGGADERGARRSLAAHCAAPRSSSRAGRSCPRSACR